MARPRLTVRYERKLSRCGHGTIAGIDEVGRGPLAGPVVAAAVVLDLDNVPRGLADSKALTAEEREELFGVILATSRVGIASVSHKEIDVINIRQASLRAMCRALAALPCVPDIALVDGNDPPDLPCPVETIIKGDASMPSIAAASIVAKVVRDRMMRRLASSFPAYGFHTNVGYRSPLHISGLANQGPCPYHRMTFAPLRGGAGD
jgi:ribonuclease HII